MVSKESAGELKLEEAIFFIVKTKIIHELDSSAFSDGCKNKHVKFHGRRKNESCTDKISD